MVSCRRLGGMGDNCGEGESKTFPVSNAYMLESKYFSVAIDHLLEENLGLTTRIRKVDVQLIQGLRTHSKQLWEVVHT